MPIRQEIKNRAYQIDPECWESYSGMPPFHKRAMDVRRTASINKAAKELRLQNDMMEQDEGDFRRRLEDLSAEIDQYRRYAC